MGQDERKKQDSRGQCFLEKDAEGKGERGRVDQWSGDTADGSKPDSIWLPLLHHDFKKVHLLHFS